MSSTAEVPRYTIRSAPRFFHENPPENGGTSTYKTASNLLRLSLGQVMHVHCANIAAAAQAGNGNHLERYATDFGDYIGLNSEQSNSLGIALTQIDQLLAPHITELMGHPAQVSEAAAIAYQASATAIAEQLSQLHQSQLISMTPRLATYLGSLSPGTQSLTEEEFAELNGRIRTAYPYVMLNALMMNRAMAEDLPDGSYRSVVRPVLLTRHRLLHEPGLDETSVTARIRDIALMDANRHVFADGRFFPFINVPFANSDSQRLRITARLLSGYTPSDNCAPDQIELVPIKVCPDSLMIIGRLNPRLKLWLDRRDLGRESPLHPGGLFFAEFRRVWDQFYRYLENKRGGPELIRSLELHVAQTFRDQLSAHGYDQELGQLKLHLGEVEDIFVLRSHFTNFLRRSGLTRDQLIRLKFHEFKSAGVGDSSIENCAANFASALILGLYSGVSQSSSYQQFDSWAYSLRNPLVLSYLLLDRPIVSYTVLRGYGGGLDPRTHRRDFSLFRLTRLGIAKIKSLSRRARPIQSLRRQPAASPQHT